MKKIETVAILGGGLLGGSLALAIQDRLETRLWARREVSVLRARELGIEGATATMDQALDGADLVILSVPVGSMPALVAQALKSGLSTSSLVTDVGSVKNVVHRTTGEVLKEAGVAFLGSHPMAGSEQRGIDAARGDLFSGAMCFLTDDGQVGELWRKNLEDFWKSLNCRICWTSAQAHDQLVARISHFPHLIAAAAAMVSLKDPTDARFGGGGLRDTTRVAGGDPDMWTEIVMENRGAVSRSIAESIESLNQLKDHLDSGNHEQTRSWLAKASELHRRSREAQTLPASQS